jgi:hypothetical protein
MKIGISWSYLIVLFLLLFSLESCLTKCYDCEDNLTSVYRANTYKDKDILVYERSDKFERSDTISLYYESVPSKYCYDITGKEPYAPFECIGNFEIQLNDFLISYHTNLGQGGKISKSLMFYKVVLSKNSYNLDTIYYNYNGNYIKTQHFNLPNLFYIVDTSRYCIDCNISISDNKLLRYSCYNKGTVEDWKLK